MKNELKINTTEIDGNARRQYIDARSVFTAYEEAKKSAAEVRGGMLWRNQNGNDYLIRTSYRRQNSLGPRSPKNETIYNEFTARKIRIETRLSNLRNELEKHRKLNKVFDVGRAPDMLVSILDKLASVDLTDYFTVIGTHSLYAYEAAAGIRFQTTEALETKDVDLLFDTQKRLSFFTQMDNLETSFIGLLKKIDSTFQMRTDQLYTAVNSQGFEVDVIRREATNGDPHPLRLTKHDEEEFYAVQAKRAGVLLDGEKFSAIVVSSTGRMARMNTISPVVFANFKRWMAQQPDRDPLKRTRDNLQAEIVDQMVEDFFPQYKGPVIAARI